MMKPNKPGAASVHKPGWFVTGGQTGGDDVPLLCYKDCGVQVKGYMPKDFRRDDGNGKEVAQDHGLWEGEGGHAWRDKKNEEISDALVAFLFDIPNTGRGTLQTLNKFKTGQYKFDPITKPPQASHTIVRGKKPSLILWNVSATSKFTHARILRDFVNTYKPKSLMVAGSTASTVPQVAELGAEVFRLVWATEGELEK